MRWPWFTRSWDDGLHQVGTGTHENPVGREDGLCAVRGCDQQGITVILTRSHAYVIYCRDHAGAAR